MDYYYTAPDDAAALSAKSLDSGPRPGSVFQSVQAKDVMACPHLEQLIAIASGKTGPSLVPQLKTLWPVPSAGARFEPGLMITRLPEVLRDDLAGLEISPSVADRWAAELWGFQPDHAASVAKQIVGLARLARDTGQPLYWWSEM